MLVTISRLASASLTVLFLFGATAQTVSSQSLPMTSAEAKASLPDPTRFRVTINAADLSPDDQQALGQMVLDSVIDQHFFGSVVAFFPKNSNQMSISTSLGLHTPEAARAVATTQCETRRRPEDSSCREIGQILPENWEPTEGPILSAEAIAAFVQLSDDAPGAVVVVRSAATTVWEMMGGEGVRDKAVEHCNARVEEAGLSPDCDVVIAD
ncbi:hypothetical protein AADZ90_019980 [Aestuariibius sp. 2305UL40-4]|uniref:hypothetical protein n=1 Tax=Aestuariibius violaceus TaxID=3234132 RepID=UPI00345E3C10